MTDFLEHRISQLREEVVRNLASNYNPVADKYKLSSIGLENTIKWKPLVLVLGNYSSGKSTLINEFIGAPIQTTGQAPTDDSFTVITGADEQEGDEHRDSRLSGVIGEVSGHTLFNNNKYPFKLLKKHGDTLASHFKLKEIHSDVLKDIAIIDTPGMLDTRTFNDRGYDYQEVIGDLASCADLVLVLFDAHKAGTLRESHESLRQTLPKKIFEDRIVYVLNRIDECENLEDIVRVYGTLCWNLSQMTGRKDIPRVLLTYSKENRSKEAEKIEHLHYLRNQQDELRKIILEVPKMRFDHLNNFLEDQSEALHTLTSSLLNFVRKRNIFYIQHSVCGVLGSMVLSILLMMLLSPALMGAGGLKFYLGLSLTLLLSSSYFYLVKSVLLDKFKLRIQANLEELANLEDQKSIDLWHRIKHYVAFNIKRNFHGLSARELNKEINHIEKSRLRQEFSRSSGA